MDGQDGAGRLAAIPHPHAHRLAGEPLCRGVTSFGDGEAGHVFVILGGTHGSEGRAGSVRRRDLLDLHTGIGRHAQPRLVDVDAPGRA